MLDQAERTLWTVQNDNRSLQCVMRSCCAGAELQVLMTTAREGETRIVLRELYPSKSDLYERARGLEASYREAVNGRTERMSTAPLGALDE